jgi:hypothetical protein
VIEAYKQETSMSQFHDHRKLIATQRFIDRTAFSDKRTSR